MKESVKQPMYSTQHPSFFLTTQDDVNFQKYSFVGVSFPLPTPTKTSKPILKVPFSSMFRLPFPAELAAVPNLVNPTIHPCCNPLYMGSRVVLGTGDDVLREACVP